MADQPRKTLGALDSPHILQLKELIQAQSRETVADWCITYAETHLLPIYEKRCPGDGRPRHALSAARDWLKGLVKFPYVKDVILNGANAAARERGNDPAAQAAARAVAQAASSIHVPSHSLGVALYGAAAVAYDRLGIKACPEEYDRVSGEVCADMASALREAASGNETGPS